MIDGIIDIIHNTSLEKLMRIWFVALFCLVVFIIFISIVGWDYLQIKPVNSAVFYILITIFTALLTILISIPLISLFLLKPLPYRKKDKASFAKLLPAIDIAYAWIVMLCILMSLLSSQGLQSLLFGNISQPFIFGTSLFLFLLTLFVFKTVFLKKKLNLDSVPLTLYFLGIAFVVFSLIFGAFNSILSVVISAILVLIYIFYKIIFVEKKLKSDFHVIISFFGFGFFAVLLLLVIINIFETATIRPETIVASIFVLYGLIQILAIAFLARFSPKVLIRLFETKVPRISKTLQVSGLAIILFAVQFLFGLPWFYNSMQTIAITTTIAKLIA